jgi:hypothetical protein
MGHSSAIRLIADGIESTWFEDIIVPLLVVAFGINVRLLSMRSDDKRKRTELYAAGWDLIIAASILACGTLFRLAACIHDQGAACSNYRRVISNARVTADEYILVMEGFQIGSILVAIAVTELVRTLGWRRSPTREWRLNGVGLCLPWLAGASLLFALHYLRNV